MANDKAPHKAVVTLNIAVYEGMPDGQLKPSPKHVEDLVLLTTGKNKDECMEKLQKGLTKVKTAWIQD